MIRVVVQDERGNEIGGAVDVPASVLAHPDDPHFSCLCFVDPYGDTVLNRLQFPALAEDLRLLRGCNDSRHEAVLREIEALIERCLAEPHLYLKMVGD